MYQGNRLRTAQVLGIGRTSLYRYLKEDVEEKSNVAKFGHASAGARSKGFPFHNLDFECTATGQFSVLAQGAQFAILELQRNQGHGRGAFGMRPAFIALAARCWEVDENATKIRNSFCEGHRASLRRFASKLLPAVHPQRTHYPPAKTP
jgi:hypothetical protein